MAKRDFYRMDHEIRVRLRAMFNRGRGTSKHKDKLANNGKPAKDKIYTDRTLDDYRRSLQLFAKAAATEGRCKNMEQARAYVSEWLRQQMEAGRSAWTVRAEAAALAKFYGCATTELGVDLPSRRQKDVVQHRNKATWERFFSEERHKDLVDFCHASGLRRSELAVLPPERVELLPNGEVIVHVVGGKGGKDRNVLCLNRRPWEIAQEAKEAGRGLVFPHIPQAAPIHAYRAEFARGVYAKFGRDLSTLNQREIYSCRGAYHGQRFDKRAVGVVTRRLGHSRLGVTVLSYLVVNGED